MIDWSERLTATLSRYDEPLVRKVAGRLLKPRNFWPVDDLITRCVETINNPAVLDRRLDELATASRQVLALIGHSRQPVWSLGNLVYDKTARNFNPDMATAARVVIAEVDEIVPVGDLAPELVATPHLFVDLLVRAERTL